MIRLLSASLGCDFWRVPAPKDNPYGAVLAYGAE
jgi:hypothetical protein